MGSRDTYVQSRVYPGKTCDSVDRIRGVYILISESKLYCLVHMYLYVCICICICKHICTY